MTSLTHRAAASEQMDDPDIAPETYRAVLGDLARVNWWTRTAAPVLAFLDELAGAGDRLRVMDVGFGQGDLLRAIRGWAGRRRVTVDLVGVDLNPLSRGAALAVDDAPGTIDYRTGDYADQPGPWDVIVSSQVAHHMRPDELDAFLGFMEASARRGWMIADLHRHRVAYLGFPMLARLLRVHRIVRQDGQLSIARSFRADEWRAILAGAGIPPGAARVRWHVPFRLCVTRKR